MNNEINKIKEEFANTMHIIQHQFYNRLDTLAEQTESQGNWKPEQGDCFYYADPTSESFFGYDNWEDEPWYWRAYHAGLASLKREEAIEVGKKMYYTQWFNNLSDVTEKMWEDFSITKHYVCCDSTAKNIVYGFMQSRRLACVPYFTSEKKLEQAIETIGRENFEKYVMRIKGD